MIRWVYRSRFSKTAAIRDVEDILRVAVRRNRDLDVTGVLLFNGHAFLQVIEGHERTMSVLSKRIRTDKRHWGVQTLHWDEVTTRVFPLWTMKLVKVNAAAYTLPAWISDSAPIVDDFIQDLPANLRFSILAFEEGQSTLQPDARHDEMPISGKSHRQAS